MQRILSTYLFAGQPLTTALLAEIGHAGIPAIEVFCSRSHFDYRNPAAVREIAEWVEENEMIVHALHSPTSREFAAGRESGVPISISDAERLRRLDAVDEIKRALDVAEQIPFRFLVQHLGASREAADPRRLDAAFNSLEHLIVFAKQRGVTIALENAPGELASPSSLRHFIADTRLSDLRLCFDVGHAHMEDGIARSFETMRDLAVTAHLHDNHGEKDEHLLPFDGSIDWKETLRLLNTAPLAHGGLPGVLELRHSPALTNPLAQAAAAFDKLEQALAAEA